MAKNSVNIDAQCAKILSDVREGRFRPLYLLMGDEPYYPELVCDAILKYCIPEEEKDFNETVCYGGEVTAAQVVTAARRFPMMAERQLVVVKEAQQMKGIEELAFYCAEPLESTVLVILLHGASVDKRKAFYKAAQKVGEVVDSPALRDYEIPNWILSYYNVRGLQIDPQAAALLAESVGTDLSTIVVETDKLTKALPEGARRVTVEDIERNVGISRQFSIFELTRELSYRHATKALTATPPRRSPSPPTWATAPSSPCRPPSAPSTRISTAFSNTARCSSATGSPRPRTRRAPSRASTPISTRNTTPPSATTPSARPWPPSRCSATTTTSPRAVTA